MVFTGNVVNLPLAVKTNVGYTIAQSIYISNQCLPDQYGSVLRETKKPLTSDRLIRPPRKILKDQRREVKPPALVGQTSQARPDLLMARGLVHGNRGRPVEHAPAGGVPSHQIRAGTSRGLAVRTRYMTGFLLPII
jgi:hypothetical protein